MARLVVADTDVVIDFLRGRGPGAGVVRSLISERRLRLTVLTAYELAIGTDFARRRDEISQLFRRRTISIDLRSAQRAGEIAAALTRSGMQIGTADSLQAGICLQRDYALASRNRQHFARVEGLELIDVSS